MESKMKSRRREECEREPPQSEKSIYPNGATRDTIRGKLGPSPATFVTVPQALSHTRDQPTDTWPGPRKVDNPPLSSPTERRHYSPTTKRAQLAHSRPSIHPHSTSPPLTPQHPFLRFVKMSDQVQELLNVPREFLRDGVQFVNRSQKRKLARCLCSTPGFKLISFAI